MKYANFCVVCDADFMEIKKVSYKDN